MRIGVVLYFFCSVVAMVNALLFNFILREFPHHLNSFFIILGLVGGFVGALMPRVVIKGLRPGQFI